MDTLLSQEAEALVALLKQHKLRLATAESCTGGLVSAAITSVSGSSEVFEFGFVTYANSAKTELLGVPAELIANHGAVSKDVACAMAEGAQARAKADIAIAITGIAGPLGGSPDKPVGTVHFALAFKGTTTHHPALFAGDRHAIRLAAARQALALVHTCLHACLHAPN